jgi:hypothetical protein
VKLKYIITAILLLFVSASVAVLIIQETKRKPQGEEKSVIPSTENMPPGGEKTFIAYYFHGNLRCSSCITIENFTATVIQNGFGVMATPSLAIDGKVVLVGRVASAEEIKKFLV